MRSSRGHLALFTGLFAVSTAGPFFMMAKVDAYAAVFWRTLLAGIVGLTVARLRGALEVSALMHHARELIVGGALMGTHFLLWIKAFDLTDFASNMLLLVAQPLVGTVVGRFLGEATPRHAFLALTIAASGMALIAGADISLGPRALLGDALCIISAVVICLFYVAARRARATLPLDVFMGGTMLAASATALPVALAADVPLWGYSTESWAWLWAFVLITTLGGHGLMNLAARSTTMFELNLVIVAEPAIAIAMGAVLFGATVTWPQVFGGALLGVALLVGLQHKPAPYPALDARS